MTAEGWCGSDRSRKARVAAAASRLMTKLTAMTTDGLPIQSLFQLPNLALDVKLKHFQLEGIGVRLAFESLVSGPEGSEPPLP